MKKLASISSSSLLARGLALGLAAAALRSASPRGTSTRRTLRPCARTALGTQALHDSLADLMPAGGNTDGDLRARPPTAARRFSSSAFERGADDIPDNTDLENLGDGAGWQPRGGGASCLYSRDASRTTRTTTSHRRARKRDTHKKEEKSGSATAGKKTEGEEKGGSISRQAAKRRQRRPLFRTSPRGRAHRPTSR